MRSLVMYSLNYVLIIMLCLFITGCVPTSLDETYINTSTDTSQTEVPTNTVQKDNIVPGVSLGDISLGDTWSSLISRFGLPDQYLYNNNKIGWFSYKKFNIEGLVLDANGDGEINPNENVSYLTGTIFFKGTYNGIGNGSSFLDVLNIFGTPEIIMGNTYGYRSKGINFKFLSGQVIGVYIFAPMYNLLPYYSLSYFPGESGGPITLNDTFSQVINYLGMPEPSLVGPPMDNESLVYLSEGITVGFNDKDKDGILSSTEKVSNILLTSPFSGTHLGIGINSTTQEVLNSFGQPDTTSLNMLCYYKIGAIFSIENDKIKSIFVFPAIPNY